MSGWQKRKRRWRGEEEGGVLVCLWIQSEKALVLGDKGSRRAEGNYAPSGGFGMLHKNLTQEGRHARRLGGEHRNKRW